MTVLFVYRISQFIDVLIHTHTHTHTHTTPQTWETRYILLLWLSIIVIIPFDLARMDGHSRPGEMGVVDRIMSVAKGYLNVGDKCRDAAALLLAK